MNLKKLKRMQIYFTILPIFFGLVFIGIDIFMYINSGNIEVIKFIILTLLDFGVSVIFAVMIYLSFKTYIEKRKIEINKSANKTN